MRPLVAVLVGIALVVIAGGAHAADPAPPPVPSPPPPAWGQPLPGSPPAGGTWGQQPPPPPGYAPYGMPYAYPAGPGGAAYYYEAQKKNELLALVIEFFVPGVGSIYADHVAGALVTWALTVGGIALVVWWVGQNLNNQNDQFSGNDGPQDVWAIYLALGMIVGGRIFGLVDSYTSARDFNHRLRERLGMPEWSGIGVVPIRTDRAVSWGPSLSFRF